MRARSFPPLAQSGARVLILGSMPGQASLAAGQYYAHPRNAFWTIMGALVDAGPELPYPRRVERLQAAGIAVWDVLAECERPGSLDADIVAASVQANDFAGLLAGLPALRAIAFNGSAAEQAFCRHVLPALPGLRVDLLGLPSTSPAHAARSLAQKLAEWQRLLNYLREESV